MEPENKKELKAHFNKFLALFIVSVLILLIPFYFTIRLPAMENNMQAGELKNIQEKVEFQRDFFTVRMDSVMQLMELYSSKSVDIDKLNADIGFLLSEMENAIVEDTTWWAGMNHNIVDTYLSLKKTNNTLLETRQNLKEVYKELKQCKKDLKNAKGGGDSLDPL